MAITHTFVSALPDDAADAAAGLVVSSNWNDDHAVTPIQIASGTITASEPAVDITQTWNNGAVTFTASKVNVTDTASASGSLLADWQVGGVSKFVVTKDGRVGAGRGYANGVPQFYDASINTQVGFQIINEYGVAITAGGSAQYQFDFSSLAGFRFNGTWPISWMDGPAGSGSCRAQLRCSDYGVLSQLNEFDPTDPQTFRVYGTYTDSSNYVRASLASSSTAVTLAAETAGTGADNIPVNLTPAGTEGVVIGNFAQFTEMTAPAAGASNTARLFCEDNGSGKTRLMVQFASGAAQQIAIEP